MTPLWKNDNIETIRSLREQARLLLEKNNSIVDKILEIDHQLNAPGNTKTDLINRKALLCQQLDAEKYVDKIAALKQKIYTLEVAQYGESHILDASPYPGERGNDLLNNRP